MADSLRWGILGTGSIARQFARGLKVSKTGSLVAVGSRSLDTAKAFAAEHGGVGVGSYAEVLASSDVDAVYIATPHHLHLEHTIAVARAGKGILCEKPFVLSRREAEMALTEVERAGGFFMEAFMYRCHPQTLKVQEILASGRLGEIQHVHAEFGFRAMPGWKGFRTDALLGGGALMDVGTYCVNFSRLVSGEEPVSARYEATLRDGYDVAGAGVLRFPGGMTAAFGCAFNTQLQNRAVVYGDAANLSIDWPWKCARGAVQVWEAGAVVEQYELGTSNDELCAFEADAVAASFEARQSPRVSWADTLGQASALDQLRESGGLVRIGQG
jgi:predicted dehydrogenase